MTPFLALGQAGGPGSWHGRGGFCHCGPRLRRVAAVMRPARGLAVGYVTNQLGGRAAAGARLISAVSASAG